MATVQESLQGWNVNEKTYPALTAFFSPDEQDQMIRDDLFAARSISLELTAVVALGLLIGLFAVIYAAL